MRLGGHQGPRLGRAEEGEEDGAGGRDGPCRCLQVEGGVLFLLGLCGTVSVESFCLQTARCLWQDSAAVSMSLLHVFVMTQL